MNSSPQMKNEDAEDCTNTSMYLSCNEESTLSSFAFQTLETTLEDPQLYDESMESDQYLNKTLEPLNQLPFLPIKTVKDVDIAPVTPLRPLAENLQLKNSWLALSSTPSQEQLLKTVDVTRGSEPNRCMDLRLAFQDMHKNKLSNRALSSLNTEDKENVLPEIDNGSSASSSAATTIIEENPLQISAAEVKTMPDTKEEIQVAKDGDTAGYEKGYESLSEKKLEYEERPEDKGMKYEELTGEGSKDDGKRLEVSASPLDVIKTTDGDSLVKNVDTKVEAKRNSDKMKPSAIAHSTNLPSKKPSKILPPGQIYQNKLKIPDKQDVTLDPEVDVCKLINKMLRMSDKQQKKTVKAADGAMKKINEKPMPSIAGEKRRVSFSQHMSIVVKTTLNSPARKLARKSILGGTTHQPRRSIMPTKSGDVTQLAKTIGTTRKSMLPRAAKTIDKAMAAKIFPPKKEKLNKLESSTKHSKVEVMTNSKTTVLSAPANTKPEATFVCRVCNEKFLIKSLLDAHKRSHEPDINPPTCLKRPSMVPTKTGGSIFGCENKCKYCDKKFALLRALHIHLLQNCPKIPPVDKRKLELTEMDHVEKAQLPNVFHSKQHSNASSSNATPRASCNFNTGRRTFRSPTRPIPHTKNVNRKTIVPGEEMMAPPCKSNLPQIKQKTAHSGVYCTPNKLISCHSCNEVFKNILDYTNHNLSAHGNSSLRKLPDVKAGALFKED
uniref:C2H2-type domain-containing protein n=1 Tax=Glossina austeni TaxID=7395 RepID=A0A1A9UJZ2_GLOAU